MPWHQHRERQTEINGRKKILHEKQEILLIRARQRARTHQTNQPNCVLQMFTKLFHMKWSEQKKKYWREEKKKIRMSKKHTYPPLATRTHEKQTNKPREREKYPAELTHHKMKLNKLPITFWDSPYYPTHNKYIINWLGAWAMHGYTRVLTEARKNSHTNTRTMCSIMCCTLAEPETINTLIHIHITISILYMCHSAVGESVQKKTFLIN